MKQKTIRYVPYYRSNLNFMRGIGVKCGFSCPMNILSAPENSGIVYKEMNFGESAKIPADFRNVSSTNMCTTLSNSEHKRVSVVEHLCAAFYALGITNAEVHFTNSEIPIFDGCAEKFIELLLSEGIEEQSTNRKSLRVLKHVKVGDDSRWASFSPAPATLADTLLINIECDYTARGLVTSPYSFEFSQDAFIKDISKARSFGFISDLETLLKKRCALGASLENTLVFDDKGKSLNAYHMRYPNEPMRHKVLDIIGDLSLSQYYMIGQYDGFCPGHKINNDLLIELFKDGSNYEIIE